MYAQAIKNLDFSHIEADEDRYDILARMLHWVFALIIIYVGIGGFALELVKPGPLHDALSHYNVSLATLLLPLFPIRLLWKFIRTNPRDPVMDKKQLIIAHLVHNLMYAIIFIVLASGVLMMPHGYMVFGTIWLPTPYEKGPVTELFLHIHTYSTMLLCGLVGMHMLGVFHHMVIRRVNILRRML